MIFRADVLQICVASGLALAPELFNSCLAIVYCEVKVFQRFFIYCVLAKTRTIKRMHEETRRFSQRRLFCLHVTAPPFTSLHTKRPSQGLVQ